MYVLLTYPLFVPWAQVDFVKLMMDKLMRLHQKFVDTPYAARFPRPAFKVRSRHLPVWAVSCSSKPRAAANASGKP